MQSVELPDNLAEAMDRALDNNEYFDTKAELIEEWAQQGLSVPISAPEED